jgi:hypothetical protein
MVIHPLNHIAGMGKATDASRMIKVRVREDDEVDVLRRNAEVAELIHHEVAFVHARVVGSRGVAPMCDRIQGGTHPVSGIEQDLAPGMPDQEERHRHGNPRFLC